MPKISLEVKQGDIVSFKGVLNDITLASIRLFISKRAANFDFSLPVYIKWMLLSYRKTIYLLSMRDY